MKINTLFKKMLGRLKIKQISKHVFSKTYCATYPFLFLVPKELSYFNNYTNIRTLIVYNFYEIFKCV